MSRSNPPRSPIVEKVRNASALAGLTASPDQRSFRRTFSIRLAASIRWLHIYLSMFGLAAVLFFSVTGLTLNHPDWFYGETERSVQFQGQLSLTWLRPKTTEHENKGDLATEPQVNKLEIVEFLRSSHGIRGALADFKVDESECAVTFKGPGYSADAFIDRETGHYELTETSHGLIAIMNDLHKGRDSGAVWSVLIDVSAVLMTLISLTGLVLLFYLKRRRIPGLVVSVVGAIVVVVVYMFFQ
ncbi:hypothetical protein SAMN05444166_1643 [Singulisphaera sp. GP187]|uniref:PepSY-associated TM helix domain-containing protein n=1 Tax=Singulisphaera sp. GP187 TaxID=1882752 RepID=UPI00092A762C|nr:PepSY-associated TM helix domain-containing protein [Singulisphaera sp. GP187]SIN92567.1 hypothetical protein SAMN05444166_1643 [Singulisphaera sp. GP187]